ncbi:Alpha/Beta hydrolase [Pacmanvirus A23]|uniref:Alpha/Beta hydrolase n=1 Tax=Pacmanvirus A23 TaxID=1932881 RepID=UPI000A095F58|nr:Alpha/Beta hydrolase [Pacmanvirus A23]SIP86059.1 Alpha/Beta hydrolase [Pacmanvirus A23]
MNLLIILLVLLLIFAVLISFVLALKLIKQLPKLFQGGDSQSTILFIPGLGNGRESWNWNTASDELINKMKIPRNSGIESPVSEFANVITFNPPGINNELSVPDSLDNYCKYIHSLTSEQTPYVVAHSIGCVIANRYAELYPTNKMLFLDPTPDFVLNDMSKPDFYTKSGGKYDITKKYIDMIAGCTQRVSPSTRIIYNLDDNDPRKKLFKEYIENNYSNTLELKNKSHFIHLVEPKLVIEEIRKLII